MLSMFQNYYFFVNYKECMILNWNHHVFAALNQSTKSTNVFPFSVGSWNYRCSSWYHWGNDDQNNRSCNDCKTWNWCLHRESNSCHIFSHSFNIQYIVGEVGLKIKLDAGSHKLLIKGFKWGTERQHSWWLVWDSHQVRELIVKCRRGL